MKKTLYLLILIFSILPVVRLTETGKVAYANDSDIETQLSDEINTQIDEIEIADLEALYEESKIQNFESLSLKEILSQIISGDYVFSFQSVFGTILGVFGASISAVIPSLCIILALALLSVFISSMQIREKSSVKNIVFYVFFVAIVSSVIGVAYIELSNTVAMLTSIQNQIQIVSPILLSLMVAVGGSSSAAIYQPAVLMLGGTIIEILIVIVTPVFIFSVVCSVVGNISESTKLSKFQDLLSSIFKIVLGLVFTVFIAFLSIQGITASTVDGISIKTAKYAIKSYVPIVGGYMAEGFEIFRAGSVLIKNSIGVIALIILLGTILSRIISIFVLLLGLKLVAALIEPIADARITKFITNTSKSFVYLIAIVLSVAIMYFIALILIVSTANIF